MVASDSFADFLREQLAGVGHVTLRRMFGKTGVFCDGLMLAMVRDDALYFRVDGGNRPAFVEKEAADDSPVHLGDQRVETGMRQHTRTDYIVESHIDYPVRVSC